MYVTFLDDKFGSQLHYSCDSFYIKLYSQPLSTLWHLKVTQAFLCFWVNQVYILLPHRNVFVSSSCCVFISFLVDFVVFLVTNSPQGLTLKNFLKIGQFSQWTELCPLRYWEGTEIQILKKGFLFIKILFKSMMLAYCYFRLNWK